MSMEINEVENFKSQLLDKNYDIIDIPGQGFYKTKIIDKLPNSKLILFFIDSADK
jgi:hypothetical protein